MIKSLISTTARHFASMVINVLYFNSIWKDKFIKEDTEKQKFHVGEKSIWST